MHIDTDEFVAPSRLFRQMKPDYVKIQPIDQPGSVLNLIQQVVNMTADLVNYPCISMPRILFGSVETNKWQLLLDAPDGFNPMKFETIRWRYHSNPRDRTLNGEPKVILDVSAIPSNEFQDVLSSIHRPVPQYCKDNDELQFSQSRKQPIATNHYVGSWDRYSRRDDRRRNREAYKTRAQLRRRNDDGLEIWLKGFVREFTPKIAAKLLGKAYLLDGNQTTI